MGKPDEWNCSGQVFDDAFRMEFLQTNINDFKETVTLRFSLLVTINFWVIFALQTIMNQTNGELLSWRGEILLWSAESRHNDFFVFYITTITFLCDHCKNMIFCKIFCNFKFWFGIRNKVPFRFLRCSVGLICLYLWQIKSVYNLSKKVIIKWNRPISWLSHCQKEK